LNCLTMKIEEILKNIEINKAPEGFAASVMSKIEAQPSRITISKKSLLSKKQRGLFGTAAILIVSGALYFGRSGTQEAASTTFSSMDMVNRFELFLQSIEIPISNSLIPFILVLVVITFLVADLYFMKKLSNPSLLR